MDINLYKKYDPIKHLNVSRETCIELESLISMILNENGKINIISKKILNEEGLRQRHIIDSAQAIDFVNLNSNTTYDLGSGAGFPGLVIAIMVKNIKKNMKLVLYEKSYHKSQFLEIASKKLKLNTQVVQEDIFKKKGLKAGTIMSRAFKPLPVILDLINNNFKSYKNIILFMGKSGHKILNETLKKWDMKFIKKKSLTSEDSFLLNIMEAKKKIK